MRRARWKRKNIRDELTALSVNSPKTEVGRHALPTKLETPLPAALYSNLKSVRPRTCRHTAHQAAKPDWRISDPARSASLRAAPVGVGAVALAYAETLIDYRPAAAERGAGGVLFAPRNLMFHQHGVPD